MTATSSQSRKLPGVDQEGSSTQRFLQIAFIWHIIVSIAALVGLVYLWTSNVEFPVWQRVVASVIAVILGVASGFASPLIRSRDHRGRVLSLGVNYFGFLLLLLSSMHLFGIFTGIDALANTFGRGVPFIGFLVSGYLINGFGERAEKYPARQRLLRQIGNVIMGLSLIGFLFAIGLLQGVIAILVQVNTPRNIALALGVLLFGAFAWFMWRGNVAKAMHESSDDLEMLNGYLFLSPNLLGFLFFFAGPLLLSLYVSFTNADGFGNQEWVGLANYGEIFNLDFARLASPDQAANEVLDITVYDELWRFSIFGSSFVIGAQDKLFWIALRNTLVFVLSAVPFSVIPALFLANVLNSGIPGMRFFRAVYFIPSVAAVVGVALIWQWLYNSTVGWINYFIMTVVEGINSITTAGLLTDPQIGWLSDTNVALFAVVIIAAWQWLGFNTILYLAGLQNIPKSLYEAASIDGANAWNQFWRITVPLLGPTTFFVVSTTTIQAMQVFDQVFVLTRPPGGPGTSTTTMVLYLYSQGFRNFRQGYASSIAWVLFILILGLTLVQFQRQRAAEAA
ncbi:MAG: sugar ABC transporter permease [Chloroflexi bacterium]|nr:MAG: sugar ABC transporter permease [Chloroflexota bacterium]MBL1196235.1 sugar ABC transporter permease [Chloroflexota bacterium]NOH13529.1 sugar ABC transporter permease [Chloroflexota bacterium]